MATNAIVVLVAEAIGHPSLGIIIPTVIFIVSFVATYLLFRHFSKH